MATYSDLELKVIEAAKRSLDEDREKARRARMIESGVDPAEADRRIAQSRASRDAHLRALADPARFDALSLASKAQSEAARQSAGTSDRLAPDRSPECERRVLAFLSEHGPSSALDVARDVSGDSSATRAYINPTLYRLAARGEVALTEQGWAVTHGVLKTQIMDLLGDDMAYNPLEVAGLLGTSVDKARSALEAMEADSSLLGTTFATPSGEHLYYTKLID